MKKIKFAPTALVAALATLVVFYAILLIFPWIRWTNSPDVRAMEELRYQCKSVAWAKQLAGEDFKKGRYRVIEWGLARGSSINPELEELLRKKFNVQLLSGGCVSTDRLEVYDEEMRRLLLAKYGEEPLDETYREAKKRHQRKRARH